jgi:hypothetical protein
MTPSRSLDAVMTLRERKLPPGRAELLKTLQFLLAFGATPREIRLYFGVKPK